MINLQIKCMNYKNTLMFLKAVSFVLGSISVIYGIKYYKSKQENITLQKTILTKKKNYVNDLNEIFSRYDNELIKNKKLTSQISQNLSTNSSTKSKFYKVNRTEKPKLSIIQNKINLDSLTKLLKENQKIIVTSKSKIETLEKNNLFLAKKNNLNEQLIERSQNLTAFNVYANGIKIVSSDIIETKRFNQTEQIKVCFTLLENQATLKGDKDLYIQIINPNNKVVSKHGDNIDFGEKSLFYSAKTNVFFDNEQLDVCAFVEINKTDIIKGDYEINIFFGTKIIGNTTFSLK